MPDLTTAVKAKVLDALDAALDPPGGPKLVAKASIFPREVVALPDLPFIRYEADATPYEHSCGREIEAAVRLHVFANGEAECETICAALVPAVEGLSGVQSAQWQGTQYIATDEASEWHGVADFRVVITN